MSAEEADDQWSIAEKVSRGDFHMILIEQAETRCAVADFQRAIFDASGFEFGRGAMHRFNSLARRVVGRSTGVECLLEFIETILEV